MNKFLRVLFIILLVVMGAHSGYGVAVGWQREIGFWNLAVLMILVAVNVKYDWFYLRVVLGALIVGGLESSSFLFRGSYLCQSRWSN